MALIIIAVVIVAVFVFAEWLVGDEDASRGVWVVENGDWPAVERTMSDDDALRVLAEIYHGGVTREQYAAAMADLANTPVLGEGEE